MPAKIHRRTLHSPGQLREYARDSQPAISPTTCHRSTRPFSSLGFPVCRGFVATGKLFFRLIQFLNVLLCCWFQTSCLIRVYETEESFHGRQGALSADGLFFSFRFWSMARPFLVFRRRRSIS